MDIIFFIAMIVALVAALGPHHRRTFSLPRAPFGADAEIDRDLSRVLHDTPVAHDTRVAHDIRVAQRTRIAHDTRVAH
ncbi:hypothetical protein [Terrabacter sp. MAHUQ-38]|jgi:hypothetical protein|uniref:hypothetical protein n=1 Tax=unclassified Terrabacter TaxID=2630222 RepID=UPI00165E2F3E|nr:hypothetical protein [Terrabacter sp. MAHUQ-38]MBC9820019.1 hypothetical protein [Terrabacter sp. MAHUQ-38]